MAGEDLTALYASPLGRAQQTAGHIARAADLPIATLDWTAELGQLRCELPPHGERCMWDADGSDHRAGAFSRDPASWQQCYPEHAPAVQPAYDAMVSASDAWLALQGFERAGHHYRVTRENRDRNAVVCHNGFGLLWLAHLLHIPLPLVWGNFWLPTTSVTTILFDERGAVATPRALCVGDTSHLFAARLPILPNGIKNNYD